MYSLTLLTILATVAATSWAGTRLIIRHAAAWGLQDVPNARSSHVHPTPRGGGAAIVTASLLGFLLLAALSLLLPALIARIGPAHLPAAAHALAGDSALQALASTITAGATVLFGALALAMTGLRDDIKPMSIAERLPVQFLAVMLLMWVLYAFLGGETLWWPAIDALWQALRLPGSLYAPPHPVLPWLLALGAGTLLLLAGVWWVNLFNFMDGIDGLAASQALFMLLAGVLLRTLACDASALAGGPGSPLLPTGPLSVVSLVLVAATAAFLLHNWAPARIFMGDTGSLFLGFMILTVAAVDSVGHGLPGSSLADAAAMAAPVAGAGLMAGDAAGTASAAAAGTRSAAESLQRLPAGTGLPGWSWLILGAAFITDATITLLRRIISGQNVGNAHRSHAYQRLSRHYVSHARATLVYCLINVLWLLPWAWAASRWPGSAAVAACIAYAPLVLLAWLLGAGRKESSPRT